MHEEGAGHEELRSDRTGSVEEEFSNMVRFIDLYIRQKIDLYIQNYVLDPLDFIIKQVIYLSVLASLLVVGTLSLAIGLILFISTLIPLWAALIIAGVVSVILAGAIAYILFSRKLVMKTPKTSELTKVDDV
ncbi:hypothetical protein CUJ83_07035 [Methanocella sp. CWC-04]|uniref:Holin-X, holin superfamily III n=1 Tax=Methanooceanicella nereidis TaxID=2052831 RepID=A0AAP2REL3_9EURY|nr:phage holin family protein [Methanocella sp. CWC-04]MCD1294752.1 hypothetical protein [Methanocella sp. CWC-04]